MKNLNEGNLHRILAELETLSDDEARRLLPAIQDEDETIELT